MGASARTTDGDLGCDEEKDDAMCFGSTRAVLLVLRGVDNGLYCASVMQHVPLDCHKLVAFPNTLTPALIQNK